MRVDKLLKYSILLALTFPILVAGCRLGQSSTRGDSTDVATLMAEPNPIQVCDGTGVGRTTLSWFAEGMRLVQIRVGSPQGKLFTRGRPFGFARTGKWIRDGTRIYLLDEESGRVMASLRLSVTTAGCE